MQQFKVRMTLLKKQLQSELPDPLPTVEGCDGVTKILLLKMCDDIHAMSDEIEAQPGTVEAVECVALIRFAVQTHESIKGLVEGGLADKLHKKLPTIIDALSQIYERTKQAYLILVKQQLRDEQELAAIRTVIEELKNRREDLQKEVDALNAQIAAAKASDTTFQKILTHAQETDQAAQERVDQANAMFATIQLLHGKVKGWEEVTTTAVGNIETAQGEITQKSGELEALKVVFDQHKKDIDSQVEHANGITDRIKQLNDEAEKTLGDANRASLAGAFKDRKSAAQWTMGIFGLIFAGALITFGRIAWNLFEQTGVGNALPAITLTGVAVRISVLGPFIWLAWFAAEQFSRANRVREDYTYKYASSMAYEGFKKAADGQNPDLAKALLAVAIYNLAENPVRLYEKAQKDHSSPMSQILDKTLGNFKGITAKSAAGEIEATMGKAED